MIGLIVVPVVHCCPVGSNFRVTFPKKKTKKKPGGPTCFRVPLASTDYERQRNRRGTGYYLLIPECMAFII